MKAHLEMLEMEELSCVNGGGLAGAVLGFIGGFAAGGAIATGEILYNGSFDAKEFKATIYTCTITGTAIGAVAPTP